MRISAASASRIKTYKDCEMKYFLEYHLRVPETRLGSIYTDKGSAVHEALEHWVNAILDNDKPGEIDYKKTLIDYYRKSKLWTLDDRVPHKGFPHPVEKNLEGCPYANNSGVCIVAGEPCATVAGCPSPNFTDDLSLTEASINSSSFPVLKLDGANKFRAKILEAEQKFFLKVGDILVRGVIDLVIEEDEDTIEIVDYKTGRSMSYNKAFNDAQVRIYGKVASLLYPKYKNVIVTLWYLRHKPVSVPITSNMNDQTIQSVKNNYNSIETNENPSRGGGWLCDYCVGWKTCSRVYDSFKVNGKFKLPVIACEHGVRADQPCWGSLRVESPKEASILNANQMTYSCEGHCGVHEGGNYIQEGAINEEI